MLPCNKPGFPDLHYMPPLNFDPLLGSRNLETTGIKMGTYASKCMEMASFWQRLVAILPCGIAGHKVPQLLQCFSLREIRARTWDTHWKQNASKGCTWARIRWSIVIFFIIFHICFHLFFCVTVCSPLIPSLALKIHIFNQRTNLQAFLWNGILLRVTAKGEATCFAEFPKHCEMQVSNGHIPAAPPTTSRCLGIVRAVEVTS